jgi:hypothetical protein
MFSVCAAEVPSGFISLGWMREYFSIERNAVVSVGPGRVVPRTPTGILCCSKCREHAKFRHTKLTMQLRELLGDPRIVKDTMTYVEETGRFAF